VDKDDAMFGSPTLVSALSSYTIEAAEQQGWLPVILEVVAGTLDHWRSAGDGQQTIMMLLHVVFVQ